MRAAAAVLMPLALLLAACGQKGDLYIPAPREAVVTVPADATLPTGPEEEDEGAQTQPQPPPQQPPPPQPQ
jgi:predicted small lipoprotein YifL